MTNELNRGRHSYHCWFFARERLTRARDLAERTVSTVRNISLMLRPSPPRFLNLGDRIELPLMVQNQSDQPLEVELALRARIVEGPPFVVGTSAYRRAFLPLDVDDLLERVAADPDEACGFCF